MLLNINLCETSGGMWAFYIVKTFVNIVCIVIPLLIIYNAFKSLMGTVITAEKLKENFAQIMKSVIAGLIVFFVPTIMNFVFGTLIEFDDSTLSECYTSSSMEKVQVLRDKEEQEREEKRKQQEKENKEALEEKAKDEKDKKDKLEENESLREQQKKDKENKNQNNNNTPSYGTKGKTQASEFFELGERAYQGDKSAQEEWINKVGPIVQNSQHQKYGMKNSLIIAQIINESGWMHTPTGHNADGSTLTGNNNIIGINYDMGKPISQQDSTWSKNPKSTQSNVTQWNSSGTQIVGTSEAMRTYDSIEDCIEDYANVMYLYHPECKGNNNIECYRSFLNGYTPRPSGMETITDFYIGVIKRYNLERFDQ